MASNKTYFQAGRALNLSLSLVNFTMNAGENKDFRVNYAFAFKYYDQSPLSQPSVIGFNVTPKFNTLQLGSSLMVGSIFTYAMQLSNLKNSTVLNNTKTGANITLIPSSISGGLGMTVAIIRIPSCL